MERDSAAPRPLVSLRADCGPATATRLYSHPTHLRCGLLGWFGVSGVDRERSEQQWQTHDATRELTNADTKKSQLAQRDSRIALLREQETPNTAKFATMRRNTQY